MNMKVHARRRNRHHAKRNIRAILLPLFPLPESLPESFAHVPAIAFDT
jgi:hypothetical protein